MKPENSITYHPIGMTNVKLEKIEGSKLYVSGIDAFDGTPIIDIKPYLPSVDCIESKRNKDAEAYLGHHDQ
ncbi:MAG: TrmO family methyltransferase, partial [Prolixibacteraceae bacterium]|nr:TrmO family methyltransferase [Prolixibacteraceae bacterium]